MQASVRIESDAEASVALLTVCGAWDRPLWQTVSETLRKCLAEHPEALIVDLSGLDDPHASSAPTWMAARGTAATMDPPVQLALCIPPNLPLADKMQRLGAPRFLPVYAKVRQARVAIASRLPLTERLMVTLQSDAEAPSVARNLVSDACLAWDLPHLLHPSRIVMSELVTNAVEHAGSEMTVVVSLRGPGVHLCVADLSAEPPRLLKPSRVRRGRPLDERGLGMRLVQGTAAAWGSLPTSTGKVVWATLQPPRAGKARASRNNMPRGY
ncbi:ATP-binding protein [Paractinoplanes deccanensis]|uniref:ATP-binding protein n=1 Tax=Paractinoplanes deccanensis TaxID=113561 RepID=A0ABQ3Y8C7_9ACTN|nr:ATP-binding protein [Actinoplanes deccanensis]GID76249.1 ATP-binding protein [Actinoplanes deccanensis]